jgi:hypothetical protein
VSPHTTQASDPTVGRATLQDVDTQGAGPSQTEMGHGHHPGRPHYEVRLDFEPSAVKRRREAFKGGLTRLHERTEQLTASLLHFPSRGVPPSYGEHITAMQRAIDTLRERDRALMTLFPSCTWDPRQTGSIDAFKSLVAILRTNIDQVTALRDGLPLLALRAVHRELVRTLASAVGAEMISTLAITAPNSGSAQGHQADGYAAATTGLQHAQRVNALLQRMLHYPPDGPFQADGSLDIAALAWSSVDEEPTTIAAGADIIRQGFRDIPGVADLSNERAVGLLPDLVLSALVVDAHLLVRRAQTLRPLLDAVAPAAWAQDRKLLVDRVHRGLRGIQLEVERLGREVGTNAPRHHTMRSATEAYRQFVEGPLRDFGAPILCAARAHRHEANGSYEREVVDAIQAGEVLTELSRHGELFQDAVDMLYRNASAHANVEVVDDGIVFTERRAEAGRVVSERTDHLTDDEFLEALASLEELLLAMQMTVLPWLWLTDDPTLAAAVNSYRGTLDEEAAGVELVAGMAGLRNPVVTDHGGHVTIRAAPVSAAAAADTSGMLAVVPAALGAHPHATQITLSLEGLRLVTFDRAEIEAIDTSDLPERLPLVGLFGAKWLLSSGARWTERDEAALVTLPLTMAHFAAARIAPTDEPHALATGLRILRVVKRRLNEVMPRNRAPLTRRAVAEMASFSRALEALVAARRTANTTALTEASVEAAATVQAMLQVQEAAKAVRDFSDAGASIAPTD